MMDHAYCNMPESGLQALDQRLAERPGGGWDGFYQDRARPCPFFGTQPDESLAQWLAEGHIRTGPALDLGCGNARNAIFLARRGFAVEGVDLAATAIAWAAERQREAGVELSLIHSSVFDVELEAERYALVVDSGLFHHIAPHRRHQYVELVHRTLGSGGCFALTCFRPEGGSGLSDAQVYEHGSLSGGLGYSEAQLREQWSGPLRIEQMRPMRDLPTDAPLFGKSFLWAMLAVKP